MGTLKKGILGGFSGKVGTVVGGTWKGIDYMRSLAASVSNPNSPAQLDHRAKFSKVIEFLKPLTALLRIGFKNAAVKMSGFNAAMSYTMKNAITGAYPAYDIDYAKALITQGNLPGALNPEIASTVSGQIDFSWEDNSSDAAASADDKVLVVVYNAAKKRTVSVVGGHTRTSGSQAVTLPTSFVGDEVQCFIAFQDADLSVISNSQYVSGLIVS